MPAINFLFFHYFSEGLGESMIEFFISRQMLPKFRTAIHWTYFLINILIVAGQLPPFSVKNTDNHIVYLKRQSVDSCFILKVDKMSGYGCHIIFVDSIRTCFTLAVFFSSIQGINKFNVNPINSGSTSDHFSQLGNENLHILPETCIDAGT